MNVKNLNPLERHVEKIVLAVALAGACYIGWLALQPITVPDNPTVTAKDVEPKVAEAVAEIKTLQDTVQKQGNLTPHLHNYVEDYRKGIETVPVPPELLAADIPQFGPKNVPVTRETGPNFHPNDGYQIVTPTVPAPADPTSVADLFVVNDPLPLDAQGNPIPPQPGVTPTTHNVTLVDVSGTIALQDFLSQMNNPALKRTERVPQELQRAIVYRVEVRRRQRVNGTWTPYEPVTPSRVGGDLPVIDWDALPDASLGQAMNDVDAMFKRIVEPDFYTLPNNLTFTPPIITTLNKAKAAVPAPGTPGAAPARPGTPAPAPAAQPDDEGGPSNTSSLSPDVAAMKALPNVPFWFFDETAQGGSEYQYEVRIAMVNPTYRSAFTLKDPDKSKEPLLYSPWTIISSSVTVPSDQYFFVSSNLGNKNVIRIGVQIYKWLNGTWYSKESNVQLGDQIAGNVLIPNAVPPQPNTVEVNTGYTLVDVISIPKVPGISEADTEAILLTPDGQLVRRSARTDAANDLHAHLIQSLYHPPVLAPTTQTGEGAANPGGPGRPPVNPPRRPSDE